jgi:hypothetical protein
VPTPGFAVGTLDKSGCPVWITDLDGSEDLNHTVHVVRDLEPTDALRVLGAKPGMITPCQLPAQRPDPWTSLPRAAISPTDSGAVLLAGRIDAWTFVYDDAGFTSRGEHGDPSAKSLSANGGKAATGTEGHSLNTMFAYAIDGVVSFDVTDGDIDPGDEEIPAGLRPAVDAAGIFGSGDLEPDFSINMRVLCALAGLQCTLDDLRQIPLLVAPFS